MALAGTQSAALTAGIGDTTRETRFYPPRVTPPAQRLPLWRFVPAFVRNPLAVMPEAVYEQPMVRYDAGKWPTIYVTDPALIKTIMLDRRDVFERTLIEKRILGGLLGNGVLTARSSVQEIKTYTIRNVDAKAKTLIIEY